MSTTSSTGFRFMINQFFQLITLNWSRIILFIFEDLVVVKPNLESFKNNDKNEATAIRFHFYSWELNVARVEK